MASIVSLSDYRRKREVDEAIKMLDSPVFRKEWDNEWQRELWRMLKGEMFVPPKDIA